MKRHVAARLPQAAEGETLIGYLSARFPYHSIKEWEERIAAGELSLDGTVTRNPDAVLHIQMLLEYAPANLVEPPVRSDYRILCSDDDFFVIDKPGNLPVHPAGPYFNHTLWAMLQEAGLGEVHFINRLDRETSGVMLAARTLLAAKRLNAQLGTMQKTYLVLVHGTVAEPFDAKGYLTNDAKSAVRKKRRFVSGETVPQDGEAAETAFMPLAAEEGITLLAARPRTGRFHQIRATLFSLGYPVVGDKLYGVDEALFHRQKTGELTEGDYAKLLLRRQALHCARLEFHHPRTGEAMTAESPLPAEIAERFPWAAERLHVQGNKKLL